MIQDVLTNMTIEEAIQYFTVVIVITAAIFIWNSKDIVIKFFESVIDNFSNDTERRNKKDDAEQQHELEKADLDLSARSFLDNIARRNIEDVIEVAKQTQEELDTLRLEYNEKLVEIATLKGKIDLKDTELELLRTQLEQTSKIVKLTRRSLNDAKSSLSKLTEQYNETLKEFTVIREQLDKTKTQIHSEQKRRYDAEDESYNVKLKIAKQEARIEELEQQLERKQKEHNDLLMNLVNRNITVPIPDLGAFEDLGEVLTEVDDDVKQPVTTELKKEALSIPEKVTPNDASGVIEIEKYTQE